MGRLRVEAEGLVLAAPEIVWELVADAERYHQWGPWDDSGYEDPGGPKAQPGVIRWMKYGRVTTVEEILESEPARRLTYTVVKGIPVHDYLAEVTLTPAGNGTRIRWTASWDKSLSGRFVRRQLRTFYPVMLGRLRAAAEQGVLPARP